MTVLEITPAQLGTFDVNHQTGTRHWSEQMRRLFGLSPDVEIEFDTVLHVLHPDDRRALIAAVADSLRPDGPEHFSLENRVRWPDGSIHWLFLMAHTRHSDEPNHEALSTIGLAGDITRAKELELVEELTMD